MPPLPDLESGASPAAAALSQPPGIDNFRGLGWMFASVITASVMSLAVRDVSAVIDPRMIVLLRAAISTAVLLPALFLFASLRREMRFSRPWTHVIRGTFIALSTHLGFYTLAEIPLATATVLFFTAPIFATLMSAFFHGEKVGPRRWAAVAAGFIGALVILRPGVEAFHPAMLAAVLSSALFAAALSQSRNLAHADGPVATYVSSIIVTVVVSLPLAVPVLSLPATSGTWLTVGVLVITGAMRGYADIQAYRYGEASILAPVSYLRLILLGGAAYFLYDETPDTATIIGAVIIVAATLYISLREAHLRRRALRE